MPKFNDLVINAGGPGGSGSIELHPSENSGRLIIRRWNGTAYEEAMVFDTSTIAISDLAAGSGATNNVTVDEDGVLSSGVPAAVAKVATASLSVTSSTTLAVIPGLSVPVVAGSVYVVDAVIPVTCGSSGGYKVSVHGTASGNSSGFNIEHIDTQTPGLETVQTGTTFKTSSNPSSGAGSPYLCRIRGTVAITVSGTLEIHFAQAFSDSTPSVASNRSTMIVTKV